jgi:hypothetical protein
VVILGGEDPEVDAGQRGAFTRARDVIMTVTW